MKNHVCFFLHPKNMLGLQFFFNVSLIELNAWEDEWFIIIKALQERNEKEKTNQKEEEGKKVI
jgi:hypothetical protein